MMDGSTRYIALDTSDDVDAERGRRVALLAEEAGEAVGHGTAAPRVDRVKVIAPATLPGGYELPCDFRGRSVTIAVPPEGVEQGDKFVADVIRGGDADAEAEAEADGVECDVLSGHRIPYGRWRDGICDCFTHGVCHPLLWLACCCPPLAIGQIMTRMGLSKTGKVLPPDNGRGQRTSAFKVVACIFVFFLVIRYVLNGMWSPYRNKMFPKNGNALPSDDSGVPAWAWEARGLSRAILFAFFVYLVVLLTRTRAHVRRTYNIPEQCCSGRLEDCCCSCWLMCCTIHQIARHTAEYDKHPAACCTETGLLSHQPHSRHHRRPAEETPQVV